MKNKIDAMIAEIIKIEAGYVNNPHDSGGPTKYGITLKTLEAWRNDDDLYSEDVKALTKSEAAEIYEENYYLHPGINYLPELIQPVVFDMSVNMGPVNAIKLMQRVIHKMGTPIEIDGYSGPRTRQSAVIACNVYGKEILQKICDARIEYYRDIVKEKPEKIVFLDGWENRAHMFLA